MNEDKEIRMSERVYATLLHRHYKVEFPFTKEAVDRMRLCPTAFWERSLGWSVSAHKADALRAALTDIEGICKAQGVDTNARDTPLKRSVILHNVDQAAPPFLEGEKGLEKVVRLGAPFVASRALAKSTGLKISGKMVRYAYHRPASEIELDELNRSENEASSLSLV